MKRAMLFRLVIVSMISSAAMAQVKVPYERIRNSDDQPGNWLTYGGDYAGHRYSKLDQLTPENVKQLKVAWVYQSREAGKWEVTPLVVDGVLYISERPNIVTALDGRTGRELWTYRRPMANDVAACCGPVNRGLAILGDSLYLCTYDAHLVCIDANTGHERWDTVVANYKDGYSMTVAPLAVKDKIICGISGAEFGVRGFIDAYDAKTGKQVWRFWTIPGPGEPGHESWASDNDHWKNGGGTAWVTGTYDPELNLLYWGTGNPGPDYDGDERPGDNLYTCCVVALDPDTGKLAWHYQYTPHDVHDWDSNQVPVLVDATIDGMPRKLLVQANRNGHYYVLDRTDGKFITGTAFAKQNWADGFDEHGRPILVPGRVPTTQGVTVYPGIEGAVNWPPPSYSPRTGLFYVHGQDNYGQVFVKIRAEYHPGRSYEGGGARNIRGAEPYGAVKAIDATTGNVRWEFKEQSASNAGILTTATNLLFTGTRDGYFYALGNEKGQPLWRFQTGGEIHGGPVTFMIDGKQHVAVASGMGLFVFAR